MVFVLALVSIHSPVSHLSSHSTLLRPLSTSLHPTAAAPAVRRQLACQSLVDPQLRPLPEAIHLTGEMSRQLG